MNNQSGSLLETGAIVTIGSSRSRARIGSFLVDKGSRLFATVNFVASEGSTVYWGDAIAGIVRPLYGSEEYHGARSVNEAVAVFEVSRGLKVARSSGAGMDATMKPIEAIGSRVFLDDRDGPEVPGRIVAIDAPMHLRDAHGSERVFTGAIEIEAEDAGTRFADDGDGGLVVRSDDGRAAGFLIARADRTFVAVPIDAVLARHGMLFATEAAIERHNSIAAVPAPFPIRHSFRTIFPRRGVEAALHSLDGTASDRLNDLRPRRGYDSARQQSPCILWTELEAGLVDDPNALARLGERDDLMGARLNYVVGLDKILRESGLSRQQWVLQLTHRKGWNQSHAEAVDLFDMNAPPLPERDVRHLVHGRAASMHTIMYVISASRRLEGSQRRTSSKLLCYIEPALFTAARDTNALKAVLSDAKSRRQYQQIYDRVTADTPGFHGQSPFTLIDELAQGRVVRYATAWVIQTVTSLFGGRGLEWQSLYSTDTLNIRPAAIEDRREAARIAS